MASSYDNYLKFINNIEAKGLAVSNRYLKWRLKRELNALERRGEVHQFENSAKKIIRGRFAFLKGLRNFLNTLSLGLLKKYSAPEYFKTDKRADSLVTRLDFSNIENNYEEKLEVLFKDYFENYETRDDEKNTKAAHAVLKKYRLYEAAMPDKKDLETKAFNLMNQHKGEYVPLHFLKNLIKQTGEEKYHTDWAEWKHTLSELSYKTLKSAMGKNSGAGLIANTDDSKRIHVVVASDITGQKSDDAKSSSIASKQAVRELASYKTAEEIIKNKAKIIANIAKAEAGKFHGKHGGKTAITCATAFDNGNGTMNVVGLSVGENIMIAYDPEEKTVDAILSASLKKNGKDFTSPHLHDYESSDIKWCEVELSSKAFLFLMTPAVYNVFEKGGGGMLVEGEDAPTTREIRLDPDDIGKVLNNVKIDKNMTPEKQEEAYLKAIEKEVLERRKAKHQDVLEDKKGVETDVGGDELYLVARLGNGK